jgi:hypothetical protein
MTQTNHYARWIMRAACTGVFSLTLAACNLGYEGLESLVDPGNPEGSCSEPAAATIRSIEVSRGSDGSPQSDGGVPFEALADGDTVPIVRGLQGSDMVVLVLRVAGVDADRCVPQRTTLVNGAGDLAARLVRPVQFRATAPGMAESRSLFLPGVFSGAQHTLTVTIGGVTLTRRLIIR